MPRRAPDLPPVVSRLRCFAETRKMLRDPIAVFSRYTAELGDTFVFYFGGIQRVLVSSDADVLRHVLKTNWETYHKSDIQMRRMRHFLGPGLLTSHGDTWRTQRRLIQQGFHRDQLAAQAAIMHDSLAESLREFDEAVQRGPVDVYPQMMKITFRMVGRSLFSAALARDDVDLIGTTISRIQEFIIRQIGQPYLNPWFVFSGELRRHEQMRARADRIVLRHIEARRQQRSEHADLLQILMDARYSDGEGMSDETILDETVQLLVAGHETSSNALSWTLYLLSKHPQHVERLRREFDHVLGGAAMQYADVPKLEFATQVLEEAMRLYPPFWMIDRVAMDDDRVAGVAIPKGTMVIGFIYGAHHSAKHWDAPERFDPERFSREGKQHRTAFTHLPFGGGPRGCIGSNYAMLQMLMILSTLLARYDFELAPNQTVSRRPMLILRPKGGITMTVRKARRTAPPEPVR